MRILRPLSLISLFLWCSSTQAQTLAKVEVTQPALTQASQVLRLTGTVTAEKHSRLSVQVDGLVTKLTVDDGSEVAEGDVLLELDPVLAEKDVVLAEAQYQEAINERREAARQVDEGVRLSHKNLIPPTVLAERRAAYATRKAMVAAAEANLATAQEQLKRHTLSAPFSGVISQKQTEVGEWITRGQTVLELVTSEKVRLDVQVPQEQFTKISPDTPVMIEAGVGLESGMRGTVSAIVPVSDPVSRSFLVRIHPEDKTTPLLPGKSATAVFTIEEAGQQQLSIPRDALLRHPDEGYSVFIVKENRAIRRPVQIGQRIFDRITILEGLEPDDQVVIRGNEILRDQEKVDVLTTRENDA